MSANEPTGAYSDKDKLKQRLQERSENRVQGLAIFFDRSKPSAARLEAIQGIGTFKGAEADQGQAIVADGQEPSDIRAAAIRRLPVNVSNNRALMNRIVDIVRDTREDSAVRKAAIELVQALSIASAAFPAYQPQYTEALRSMIDDPDKGLKEQAIELLALRGDEVVQQRLIKGLEEPEAKVTEPEVAIQLLAYDLHANYFPLMQKIALDPPNVRSKQEALRNLASDPSSESLITQVLNDSHEDIETRHICAIALGSLNPAKAVTYTLDLIEDKNVALSLKASLLGALKRNPKRPSIFSEGLANELSELALQQKAQEFELKFAQLKQPKEQLEH